MQSTAYSNYKGFTLVEAIVSGALSIFVLLTAMTLYRMNADQIRGSFVSSITKMQYQTVIDQIEINARQGKVILSSNATTFFETNTSVQPTDVIYFISDTGSILGGYQHTTDSLKEWNGTTFIPFKVGNKNIKLKNTGSAFTISPDRKSVLLNLSIIGTDGMLSDTMLSKGETFACRN